MPVAAFSRSSRSIRNWSALRRQRAQFVELGVEAVAEHAAVAQQRRRRVDDGALRDARQCRHVRRAWRASSRSSGLSQSRERCRASAARASRPSRNVDRSRGRAERSATRARMRSRSPTPRRISRRPSYRRASISAADRLVARAAARARSRSGRCSQRRSRRAPIGVIVRSRTPSSVCSARPLALRVELEIAPRRRVERDRVVRILDREARDVRQRGFLRFLDVAEQAPAAAIASGMPAQPKPDRSRVPKKRAELARRGFAHRSATVRACAGPAARQRSSARRRLRRPASPPARGARVPRPALRRPRLR